MYEYELPVMSVLPTDQTFHNFIPQKDSMSMSPAQKLEVLAVLSDFILNRLAPWCTEFSNRSIVKTLGMPDKSPGSIRFVYRVYPDLYWTGQFIIQAKSNNSYEDLFSTITCGSQKLTECCQKCEVQILAQSYAFLEITKIFREYYQKKGRFYPAYIQLCGGTVI